MWSEAANKYQRNFQFFDSHSTICLSAIGNDIVPDLVSIFDRDLGFLQRAWFQSLIGIYGFSRYIVRGESLPIKGFKPSIGI
ncbi:hypothetical protein [Microcoleus sp.]|uniref:hypothetical protein n=1 Tax=Microcoleus sp. TaxID=44472 RepID=UPI004040867E